MTATAATGRAASSSTGATLLAAFALLLEAPSWLDEQRAGDDNRGGETSNGLDRSFDGVGDSAGTLRPILAT